MIVLTVVLLSIFFTGCELPEHIMEEIDKQEILLQERYDEVLKGLSKTQVAHLETYMEKKGALITDDFETVIEEKMATLENPDIDFSKMTEKEMEAYLSEVFVLFGEIVGNEMNEIFAQGHQALNVANDFLNSSFYSSAISDWSVFYIIEAYEQELLTKKVSSHYKNPITREEFCELVIKLYEKTSGPVEGTSDHLFTDTNNPDINKAFHLGIVNGVGNNRFDPNGNITREQIAVMFDRLLNALEVDFALTMEYRFFADEKDIADWAKNSVQTLNKLQILNGVGNDRINPKGTATKEQAIVMLVRLFDNL